MENNLQIFTHDHFGELRTVEKDGRPWIVAADVCRILEIKDVSKAVSRLDDDEKGTALIRTLGGEQAMLIVNEFGFYRLVLASRKKTKDVREFQRWVYHEVIPNAVRQKILENAPDTEPESEKQFLPLEELNPILEKLDADGIKWEMVHTSTTYEFDENRGKVGPVVHFVLKIDD